MPRKKGSTTVPKNETKRARFIRLAESRMTKAMHHIKIIGNLNSKVQYEYSQGDVDEIVNALKGSIEDIEYRLGGGGGENPSGFKLGTKPKTSKSKGATSDEE